jgi:hypothetical protein
VKKKRWNTCEDFLLKAEMSYQAMLKDVFAGKIDKNQMVAAMNMINNAHYAVLREGKRHLLR